MLYYYFSVMSSQDYIDYSTFLDDSDNNDDDDSEDDLVLHGACQCNCPFCPTHTMRNHCSNDAAERDDDDDDDVYHDDDDAYDCGGDSYVIYKQV